MLKTFQVFRSEIVKETFSKRISKSYRRKSEVGYIHRDLRGLLHLMLPTLLNPDNASALRALGLRF
jgi:hypothetical protein